MAEKWYELSRTLLLFLDSLVHRVTKTGANFSVVAVVVTGLLCVFNSIKCGSASVFALCVSEVRLLVTIALTVIQETPSKHIKHTHTPTVRTDCSSLCDANHMLASCG